MSSQTGLRLYCLITLHIQDYKLSLIHVLPSIGTYAFTTPNLANRLMETRKWRVWLTHPNNHLSVLQSWQGQGMTQEYILYFLDLDYSHSCLVQPNSLACMESVKRTSEKTVLSFPCTCWAASNLHPLEQPPYKSRLTNSMRRGLDLQKSRHNRPWPLSGVKLM